ncbi:MAG: sensor histidine kinase [Candidatus Pseudobacter hemicellulosilyticus]|uniref:Sensor histidine kinase n=1 Tax=Candidatus Pseudobacter hemicellulosilyticus TaxID=3121375 RepID=A0AAJ5WPM1_9BACT|nr:MAG: sensor histidine kinase [Pseudobacter sp.]
MPNKIQHTRQSSFPFIYEGMVWVLYTVFYKYSYYVNTAGLPNPDHSDFPYPGLLLYALALTLYVIPFYRWLAPWLLARKKFSWLPLLALAWFLLVPKLANAGVSYLFLHTSGPGPLHQFYSFKSAVHLKQLLHWKGWDFNILLTDLLAFGSVALTRYAFDNDRKKQLLEKDLYQVQLEVLKARLNPHFLFNTLNSIYGMSLTGHKETPNYILRLSDMMRYILHDSQQSEVPLEMEIAFTRNYVEMERIRYPDRDIRFTVSGDAANRTVAPLLLIPFVENAFKHGAFRILEQGFIHMDLHTDQQALTFVVKNDVLAGINADSGPGGVGISNIQQRLQLHYPGRHQLELDNNGQLFTITLRIQFK